MEARGHRQPSSCELRPEEVEAEEDALKVVDEVVEVVLRDLGVLSSQLHALQPVRDHGWRCCSVVEEGRERKRERLQSREEMSAVVQGR